MSVSSCVKHDCVSAATSGSDRALSRSSCECGAEAMSRLQHAIWRLACSRRSQVLRRTTMKVNKKIILCHLSAKLSVAHSGSGLVTSIPNEGTTYRSACSKMH